MPDFVLPAPVQPSVPVQGGGRFAVRRIFCVGRNYAAHVQEMGGDPQKDPPIFFTKPADAIVTDGAPMPYPPQTQALHHEIELVVALGSGGAMIAEADAPSHIFGYACGLDMTRRDLQAAARSQGQPWDMAKGFDHSAPIGAIARAADTGLVSQGRITLRVNGDTRQDDDLSHMIFPVAKIISVLSSFVTLEAGDLIFTGTPENVGAVTPGDVLAGEIAGVGTVATKIIGAA